MAEDTLTLENKIHLEFAMTNVELQQAINDATDRAERAADWNLKNELSTHVAKLMVIQLARAEFGTVITSEVQPNGGSAEPQRPEASAQGEGSDGGGSPD